MLQHAPARLYEQLDFLYIKTLLEFKKKCYDVKIYSMMPSPPANGKGALATRPTRLYRSKRTTRKPTRRLVCYRRLCYKDEPFVSLHSIGWEVTPMSRVCQVTGKRPMTGNNVSHANNKTRRRFLPNLHTHRFWVESERRFVRLRVSSQGMRIIDKKGIDSVLTELRARGEKV